MHGSIVFRKSERGNIFKDFSGVDFGKDKDFGRKNLPKFIKLLLVFQPQCCPFYKKPATNRIGNDKPFGESLGFLGRI